MSWNESLYQYHKARGGQFLAGEADDGLLILTWKDRPLAVDLSMVTGARMRQWIRAERYLLLRPGPGARHAGQAL